MLRVRRPGTRRTAADRRLRVSAISFIITALAAKACWIHDSCAAELRLNETGAELLIEGSGNKDRARSRA
jgi:hypothetical protein